LRRIFEKYYIRIRSIAATTSAFNEHRIDDRRLRVPTFNDGYHD